MYVCKEKQLHQLNAVIIQLFVYAFLDSLCFTFIKSMQYAHLRS